MNAHSQPARAATALTLCCPTCKTPLLVETTESSDAVPASTPLRCTACALIFPTLGSVTCLLPNAAADLAQWEVRAHKEQQDLLYKQQAVNRALRATDITKATRQRLQQLGEGYAGQLQSLSDLLEPLLAERASSDRATYGALNADSLSNTTTLFSYATNLFRDWVWGDMENAQAMRMLTTVAPGDLGRTLVLGAGGGRLAWDLANGPATEVYAVDINPFTSLTAAAIGDGRDVSLWEFPLAPVGAEDVAIHRTLSAPARPESGGDPAAISWLLADARALPFLPESFDTVVTPWFTDVVQSSPATTATLVNGLLVDEGRWLNFGSVAFANADPAECLLLPELCELVATKGFAEPKVEQQRGPYLCSPHSRYGRTELLHAFSASKTGRVKTKPSQTERSPAWLTQTTRPVPALRQFQDQAMATQVHAYLLSLIDGKRSIDEIADTLQQRQLMSAREATPLIQGFLKTMLSG